LLYIFVFEKITCIIEHLNKRFKTHVLTALYYELVFNLVILSQINKIK